MKKYLSVIMILLLAVIMTACGGGSGGDAGSGGGDAAAKDTLTFQLPNEPDNLDLQNNGTVLGGYLCDQIYGKLVRFDEESNVVGELAESWDWNDDFTQLTFHLRDGIKFSDGSDITADDFIYTYSTESAKANTYLSPIKSMEAPDPQTLVLNLKQSNSSQLKYMTTYHTGVVPKGSMEETDIAKGATAYSGPYMLDAWNLGQNIVFKANPNWYDAANVPIPEVDFTFIADENSALVALESGEIDFMYGPGGLSPSVIESVDETEGLETVFADQADAGMLCLNFTKPELADINVRQAINYAIDRQAITDSIVVADALGNVFTVPYFGDDYVEGHEAPARDVDKAKEYLAKSAYPNGFDVEVKVPTMYTKGAQVLQSELKDIGINVTVTEIDVSIWVDAMIKGDYEIGFMTFANLINDMTGFISLYDVNNSLHFNFDKDTTAYDLLHKALELDGAERTEQLSKFADYCDENLPYIGLFVKNIGWAHTSDLSVGKPTASGYDLTSMHW